MNTKRWISANSLGDVWSQYLDLVLQSGAWTVDEGDRLLEVCSVLAQIQSIELDDPIITQFADQDRIQLMKKKYTFCGVLPEYKISYGKLLYENDGVNQVDWVIRKLQAKRETKSATIGLHHPGGMVLSCLSLLDFKIRNEELLMLAVYRSQNVFASQPGNLVALHELQCQVASALNCRVGPVELLVASAHIY